MQQVNKVHPQILQIPHIQSQKDAGRKERWIEREKTVQLGTPTYKQTNNAIAQAGSCPCIKCFPTCICCAFTYYAKS